MRDSLKDFIHHIRLPRAAKLEKRKDAIGVPRFDPGIPRFVDEAITWICRAQDYSTSQDGGVSRDFSLIDGWATSYPETTGYIVPTMIAYGKKHNRDDVLERGRRMIEWLVSIQLESGAFQGGKIDARPVIPVTFNTGQILLGLAAGYAEFDTWGESLARAADWLVDSLDKDGCWRKFPTPFAAPGEKTYETHVSWGLFEAERVMPGRGYAEAGLKQVRWALQWQHKNGWLEKCCLSNPDQPLTHTLGYALRGIIEAYRISEEDSFLDSARKTADGLLSAFQEDGFLPGRLLPDWSPAVPWCCLTGSVQIADSLLMLYQSTNESMYRDIAFRANEYVRRTMIVDGSDGMRGGVKGSFPVDGDYGQYEFLNWAAKFAVDSNLRESAIRATLEILRKDDVERPIRQSPDYF